MEKATEKFRYKLYEKITAEIEEINAEIACSGVQITTNTEYVPDYLNEIVEQLVEEGLVGDIADLYSLGREDLLKLEGFAEKKADNLLEAIDGSRGQPLGRLINALGIKGIGEVTAADLARHYHDLDALAAREKEVGRLDIAVDDACVVGVLQAGADLHAEFRDVARAEVAAAAQDLVEREALEHLARIKKRPWIKRSKVFKK